MFVLLTCNEKMFQFGNCALKCNVWFFTFLSVLWDVWPLWWEHPPIGKYVYVHSTLYRCIEYTFEHTLDEDIPNLSFDPPIPRVHLLPDTLILLNLLFFKQENLLIAIDKPNAKPWNYTKSSKTVKANPQKTKRNNAKWIVTFVAFS